MFPIQTAGDNRFREARRLKLHFSRRLARRPIYFRPFVALELFLTQESSYKGVFLKMEEIWPRRHQRDAPGRRGKHS